MINEKEFEDFVFTQALENAVLFDGKAALKAIFGKVIPKFPQIKTDIKHYMNEIDIIVKQVNLMSKKEQIENLMKLNPNFFEKKSQESHKKEEKKTLINLPELKGKFVGRFSPAPSGYLTIGHAINIVFNYEYKQIYGGKFIVRFEDTNPEKIDIKNYDRIIEDIRWLTDGNIDEIFYQSDRLETYYKYLRELVETNHAYVCECLGDTFKSFNDSSTACPHRNLDVETQKQMYDNFFNGKYKDGDAVIRFKMDLNDKNPALRDIPIARLNSTPHARVGTKYKLWPMYNFATAVDDGLMGITYIVRGKDAEIGAIRQDKIKDVLGFKKVPYYHFGRIQFTDIVIGKTPLKEKIAAGVYTGWDDPRVPTLLSFRKRGFKPKAFRDMYVAFGMSKRDMKMAEKEFFKSINFFNKQILEKEADRYAFVMNPKEVEIANIADYSQKELILPKHPDFKERGYRKIAITNKYYIDGIDFENLNKGDIIRLMHFANFEVIDKKEKLELKYLTQEYDKNLKLARNIQFVPFAKEQHRNAEIIMQDNSRVKGIVEPLNNPKEGTSLQFERFGFVKYDHKKEDGTKVFYFTQR